MNLKTPRAEIAQIILFFGLTLGVVSSLHTSGPLSIPITAAGQPAVLNIRAAGTSSIRITLKPENFMPEFPLTPVLPDRDYPRPVLSLREIKKPVKAKVAGLLVEVQSTPLRIIVLGKDGTMNSIAHFSRRRQSHLCVR